MKCRAGSATLGDELDAGDFARAGDIGRFGGHGQVMRLTGFSDDIEADYYYYNVEHTNWWESGGYHSASCYA